MGLSRLGVQLDGVQKEVENLLWKEDFAFVYLLDQVLDGCYSNLRLVTAHKGHLELNDKPVIDVESADALLNHLLLFVSKLVFAEVVDDFFVLPVLVDIKLLRSRRDEVIVACEVFFNDS